MWIECNKERTERGYVFAIRTVKNVYKKTTHKAAERLKL